MEIHKHGITQQTMGGGSSASSNAKVRDVIIIIIIILWWKHESSRIIFSFPLIALASLKKFCYPSHWRIYKYLNVTYSDFNVITSMYGLVLVFLLCKVFFFPSEQERFGKGGGQSRKMSRILLCVECWHVLTIFMIFLIEILGHRPSQIGT